MPGDLPPVGARVRTTFGAEGVVEQRHYPVGRFAYRTCFVRWDLGGGMWVTADEIAEVLDAD